MAPLHLVGRPLTYDELKPHMREVRRRGVKQFLTLYKRVEHIQKPELLWGDELEYHILSLSGDSRAPDRAVSLSLRAPELLDALIASEGSDPRRYDGCSWHAEYGRWMVEATPREPFGGYATELLRVERSMRLRRQRLLSMLRPDEIIPTIPSFPLMGVGAFTQPAASPCGPAAASSCVPDAVINPHPRMATLTQNIRERRGGNVEVRAPLFRDTATPEFAGEPLAHPEVLGDAMAYGMGSCCLQITFQARDVNESRFLTDQLAVLGPIMLALTAATPIFHGRLVDTDVRWDMICQSVDDRTPAERRGADEPVAAGAEQPDLAGGGVRRLGKSRYASISHYIYDCPIARKHGLACPVAQLNDLGCEVDEEMFQLLREGGVDDLLAQHMAFNFSRDPLVLFAERIDVDDEKETDHFENIQSTNWNSVRWKPPPSMDSPIGWRTEFRTPEIQMTDFENAAFATIMVLLTRTILAFDLDLLVPISQVDENMRRAHARDGVLLSKFFFRKHLVDCNRDVPCGAYCCESEEMSIAEILNGKGTYFPGLLPLVDAYVESIRCDAATRGEIRRYMKLLALRANGTLMTGAAWQRKFVQAHPDYRADSVVPQTVAHDLMLAAHEIGVGKRECREVLGNVRIEPILPADAWDVKLESSRLDSSTRSALIKEYMTRPAFLTRLKRETSDSELPDVCEIMPPAICVLTG